MIYLDLLIGFLEVGFFSFGGAYAAIPLIREGKTGCTNHRPFLCSCSSLFWFKKIIKKGIFPIMLICVSALVGVVAYGI